MTPTLHTPTYDSRELTPGIVHFGVGNFHRSHQAMYLDRLIESGGHADWGIVGVGVLPGDVRMRDALASQDYRYTLVEKAGDGSLRAQTIGAIIGMLIATEDPDRVIDLLADPAIRIVSLTITEGGYNIDRTTGIFDLDNPAIQHDLAHSGQPSTVFGYIVAGLRRRRDAGIAPFTVMSCDNLPGNGEVAHRAILTFAEALDPVLAAWIDANVTFPNAMVDRITPVTTDTDRALVRDTFGIADAWPVMTEPFVQWVLEDRFCNGRPTWESVGVQMVADVVPYELMKLRLLNASHQAMAYAGMLLGHTYVHEAVSDEAVADLLRAWMREARPTLPPVPGIDLDGYCDSLLERFANAQIADTLARLAVDASDRIPKFVLPAVRENLANGVNARIGAAIIASWAHWLTQTEAVTDPLAAELRPLAIADDPLAFIRHEAVFGDLASHEAFAQSYAAAIVDLRSISARQWLREIVL